MRRITFLGIITLCVFMLCSCSKKSKLESAAKEQMEKTFKEMAKDPESVKLLKAETMFSDDSLCIIHVDFTAKNALGNDVKDRYEYLFISSNGKNYESYQEISKEDDGVYVTEEKYNKEKNGTIYETLDYKQGIHYLSAIFVNGKGREAGNSEGNDYTIPVPTGTGSWNLKSYKDEFGEEGSSKYLILMGSGVFSNSATTNSDMTAILFMDKTGDFTFRLIEYSSNIVKSDNSYYYKIKDAEGDVHEMVLKNDEESGQMYSWYSEDKEIMQEILKKGGVITVAVRERDAYSTPDTYLFKMNVTGYQKAASFL